MASREEVLKVARLARIRIQESELESLQKKFSAVLEYFKFLEEANVEGIEPLFHAAEQMELRPDTPEDPLAREALLANAPEAFENCFRIPRVVGGEE
jgi:aspartyl-tRNA(Asn)/glutamyl-tRNA(Gln) amidotransferase subunit C